MVVVWEPSVCSCCHRWSWWRVSRCHQWAWVGVKHQQIIPLLYLQRSELTYFWFAIMKYRKGNNKMALLLYHVYQFVSILWGQSWWLPGIFWPIAWQRVHLVSAYNEAFAVKHITCAGRHVKSRSWRSWNLHCRFNSILAFSWKNRSRSPWMCIPKLRKVKLLVTKCLNWDIAFHIEHHFH